MMSLVMKCIFMLLITTTCFQFTDEAIVYPTFVRNKEAVCLSGLPAAYYFMPGSGAGVNNWLINLEGGGWCESISSCKDYILSHRINLPARPKDFSTRGILSNDKAQNPNFFNWNKVDIKYCDGSSFTGDSEKIDNGSQLYFRGAKIFQSVMEELLQKGMRLAKNALLVGESAGGVAAMIHCDRFRQLFPNSCRVKCLSEGGYFFPAKWHNYGPTNVFVYIFQGLIDLHRSINMLPKSCTEKLNPALCFFAQNVHAQIKTPIFFMMSEFDTAEISYTTGTLSFTNCLQSKNCSRDQIEIIQDFRKEFLTIVSNLTISSRRGFFIYSKFGHTQITCEAWCHPITGNNESRAELFGNWYFDRQVVQIKEKCQNPYGCS